MEHLHLYVFSLCLLVLYISLFAAPAHGNEDRDVWLSALPFKRALQVQSPLMEGRDVVILQNLLRRHRSIFSLAATGYFDEASKEALKLFQQEEGLTQQSGTLDPDTGRKVIELLMHDGYQGTDIPDDCKFFLYVPLYRNRSIEVNATLYKCRDGGEVLHRFRIRGRGGTVKGHQLNQLTSNGDTPTGLSTIDLNTKQQKKYDRIFGPYPILRITKGIEGNVAIGRDDVTGIDGGKESFLNDYRYGILVHTFLRDNWNKNMPMPDSLGCLKVHPEDQKKIADLLVKKAGVIANRNTYGRLPYPHISQGYISVVEID